MKKLSALAFSLVFAVLASPSAIAQQGPPPAPPRGRVIPNLVGSWSLEVSEVSFGDPTDPSEGPVFSEQSSEGEPAVFITDQVGRRFAGYLRLNNEQNQYDKMTGVVTEDGTVSVQGVFVFGESFPDRFIAWGTVTPQPYPRVITGIGQNFEDYGLTLTPAFGTTYFILRRVQ